MFCIAVASGAPSATGERLFADLIGKPVWLAGFLAMVSGQVLGALALGGGTVA
jgi:hypothetical protein